MVREDTRDGASGVRELDATDRAAHTLADVRRSFAGQGNDDDAGSGWVARDGDHDWRRKGINGRKVDMKRAKLEAAGATMLPVTTGASAACGAASVVWVVALSGVAAPEGHLGALSGEMRAGSIDRQGKLLPRRECRGLARERGVV